MDWSGGGFGDGEWVGLLVGLEVMAWVLDSFTRLVVGDVHHADDASTERVVVMKLLCLWSWADVVFEMRAGFEAGGGAG